jgi:glycosyltransferase involved in cell wall biosynthesis
VTTFAVCVATYGADRWRALAAERAVPSAADADETIVIHQPGGSLASARNHAADIATADWLVFLDGDDELTPGYLAAIQPHATGRRLLVPRVQYITRTGKPEGKPFYHGRVDMRDGNWMVIGTAVPRDVFHEVGGFEEWPIYEDWAFFARCVRAGCEPVEVPAAVYVAHRGVGSRNHAKSRLERTYWHQAIGHAVWPESYEATTEAEDRAQEMRALRRLP